jgi:hypothetical protein
MKAQVAGDREAQLQVMGSRIVTALFPRPRAARGTSPFRLADVNVPGCGRIDDCPAATVALLQAHGVRLAGTVRARLVADAAHRCDMDLQVLRSERMQRISQDLGRHARGCRPDGEVIESIAAEVEAGLAGADLLLINKFGKLKAQGCGLVRALELGIPVPVGVNAMKLSDFLRFADGLALALAASPTAIRGWVTSRLATPVV